LLLGGIKLVKIHYFGFFMLVSAILANKRSRSVAGECAMFLDANKHGWMDV